MDKLLEKGIIKPSKSAWSSPMVAVKKKDGPVRLCTDFRKVNSVMLNKDPYPLPRISDCLETLSNASSFCPLIFVRVTIKLEWKKTLKRKLHFPLEMVSFSILYSRLEIQIAQVHFKDAWK